MILDATNEVLLEVLQERMRQRAKFGDQHRDSFPNTPDRALRVRLADRCRDTCDTLEATNGRGAPWEAVLAEEVAEAMAETTDLDALRRELVQVAAVAVAWIEDLDTQRLAAS